MYLIKKAATTFLTTNKSKSVNGRVIVFESDDWGSIRTPSIEAANAVIEKGGFTTESAYLQVDTLECESDIIKLLNVLKRYRDEKGNSPIITANYVMSNPEFLKIRESNFNDYFYESFPATYKRYFGENKILEEIKKADNLKVFFPQFHGREHVNIPLWLEQLQKHDKVFLTAFDNGFFGIQTQELQLNNRNVQVTYELSENNDHLKSSIVEGLQLFEQIFGYKSKSFIPNNYVWRQSWNTLLFNNGVRFLQGVRLQSEPLNNEVPPKRLVKNRWGGCMEKGNLLSIVRNGSFEPSFRKYKDKESLNNCLNDIKIAFLFKQPAVISTHRLNFVSGLSIENRNHNLELFDELLYRILKKWPDVQFMNTAQLGDYYLNNYY
jgi:hypothetical protein